MPRSICSIIPAPLRHPTVATEREYEMGRWAAAAMEDQLDAQIAKAIMRPDIDSMNEFHAELRVSAADLDFNECGHGAADDELESVAREVESRLWGLGYTKLEVKVLQPEREIVAKLTMERHPGSEPKC